MNLSTRPLSSLSKVFPDDAPREPPFRRGSALGGEVYSFQVAFFSPVYLGRLKVALESELEPYATLRPVGLTPAEYLASEFDDNVLRSSPGLFPDVLRPVRGPLKALPGQWHAVWVTVRVPEDLPAGTYDFTLVFSHPEDGQERPAFTHAESFALEVLPGRLPPQRLLHTEWFHTDCIMSHYQVNAWSERHWELIEAYMRNAAEHGVNMILTPLFTPPLDTQVGGERPTVQLVKVTWDNGEYGFDFSRLERWIHMARHAGITHFEFAHFFTQWGAEFTPKIMVECDGAVQKRFGWHVRSDSPDYEAFLAAFIPALLDLLDRIHIEDRSVFHVSDEPALEHMDRYRNAAELLRRHLRNHTVMDALSNVDFYREGLTDLPIPSITHVDDFAQEPLTCRWCYYCCGPQTRTTNRFLHFPGARTRILGMQLYKHNMDGFLHWGYNFWYTRSSLGAVDPFRDPSAGNNFPAGDPFVVYPGEDGPLDSIRWEVIREALQDQRALQLLESLVGREQVVALLEDDCAPITMTQYPADAQWLLRKRARINHAIVAGASRRGK